MKVNNKIKLTKRTIDALQPRERAYVVFDEELTGFGIRVMTTGAMSYVVEYRPNGGGRAVSKRRMTLGKLGTLTPDQARKAAEVVIAKVKLGGDPSGELAASRAAGTLAKLIDAFKEEYVEVKLKSGTAEVYAPALELLKQKLGTQKAEMITKAQIRALHTRMSKTPYAGNRALSIWSKMFVWGAEGGLVPEGHNPARGIERYKEHSRERYLTSHELTRLGDVLRMAENEGLPWEADETGPKAKHLAKPKNRRSKLDTHAIAAIRLLILTGARLREILHAQWSQVDMERGILFLPDSKTGKKPVYLSAAALAILANIPRIEKNPYIIAGSKEGAPRADLKKPWQTITRAAELNGLRIHDLRHSFASVGAGASLGLPIIGKLLGHTQAATTARYSHLDADPMRRAADTIGATIAAALEGNNGSEVVPLKIGKVR